MIGHCFYDSALALPGFLIFRGDPSWSREGGDFHIDGQFRWNPFWRKINDFKVFTFTLPIQLPKSGGGLEIAQKAVHVNGGFDLSLWKKTSAEKKFTTTEKGFYSFTAGITPTKSLLFQVTPMSGGLAFRGMDITIREKPPSTGDECKPL